MLLSSQSKPLIARGRKLSLQFGRGELRELRRFVMRKVLPEARRSNRIVPFVSTHNPSASYSFGTSPYKEESSLPQSCFASQLLTSRSVTLTKPPNPPLHGRTARTPFCLAYQRQLCENNHTPPTAQRSPLSGSPLPSSASFSLFESLST